MKASKLFKKWFVTDLIWLESISYPELSRNKALKRDYEQIRDIAGPHDHSTSL